MEADMKNLGAGVEVVEHKDIVVLAAEAELLLLDDEEERDKHSRILNVGNWNLRASD